MDKRNPDFIAETCDLFVFLYGMVMMADCVLKVVRLSNLEDSISSQDITALQVCMATVYTILGITLFKTAALGEDLEYAARGYNPSLSRTNWMILWLVILTTIMDSERKCAKLGLFTEGSVLYIGLWSALSPYYWIWHSNTRLISFVAVVSILAVLVSSRIIRQRRLTFFKLWHYLPLPMVNTRGASASFGEVFTHEGAFLVFSGMLIVIVVCIIVLLAIPSSVLVLLRLGFSGMPGTNTKISDSDQMVILALASVVLLERSIPWELFNARSHGLSTPNRPLRNGRLRRKPVLKGNGAKLRHVLTKECLDYDYHPLEYQEHRLKRYVYTRGNRRSSCFQRFSLLTIRRLVSAETTMLVFR